MAENTGRERMCKYGQCTQTIVPPDDAHLEDEESVLAAGAKLEGFCSHDCRVLHTIDTVSQGRAWWQR